MAVLNDGAGRAMFSLRPTTEPGIGRGGLDSRVQFSPI